MKELKLQSLRIQSGWRVDWNVFYEEDINEENALAEFSSSSLLYLSNDQKRRIIDLFWSPAGNLNGNYVILVGNCIERYNENTKELYKDSEEVARFETKNRFEVVEKLENLMTNLTVFTDERIYKERGVIDDEAEEIRQRILNKDIDRILIDSVLSGGYAKNQNLLLDYSEITKEIVQNLTENGRNKGVRTKAIQKLKSKKFRNE